jgi:hypothetical protein
MDARASIVSNNLNILMKRLAVLTVVVGVINIPVGMGGMSEVSRFMVDGLRMNWILANSIFVVVLIIIGIATYKILGMFKAFSTGEPKKKKFWFRFQYLRKKQ